MTRMRIVLALVALAWAGTLGLEARQGGAGRGGWTIPEGAADEKNPFPINESVLAAGQKVFAGKCRRCHGPEGKGDGPDADAAHRADMDLTAAARASRNPDGVVFYKVWNGRSSPRMPRFSEELSREQVWAVVAYVQSLRQRGGLAPRR